jgi:hypothetical protein
MTQFDACARIAMSFFFAMTSVESAKRPAAGSGLLRAEWSWKP